MNGSHVNELASFTADLIYKRRAFMKMKKVLAIALAGAMALSLAACGGGSSSGGSSSGSADAGSADAGAASSGALTINIWDANQQAGIQEI
jgi:multiple sugar transport system substrate-binding protein